MRQMNSRMTGAEGEAEISLNIVAGGAGMIVHIECNKITEQDEIKEDVSSYHIKRRLTTFKSKIGR